MQHTFQALLAQPVRPLHSTTAGALAQMVDVLKCLASHLPMSLPRVGGLVLGNSTQYGLPDIVEKIWQIEADSRNGDGEGWEKARREARRIECCPARERGEGRGREAWEKSHRRCSHDYAYNLINWSLWQSVSMLRDDVDVEQVAAHSAFRRQAGV
jgi:hypothetical protein